MKDFKKEMENRIYYELQKDPKIKELQEQQRVNAIKAKYFDLFEETVNSAIEEGLLNSYNSSDSPCYSLYQCYEYLKNLFVVPCYSEIGEQND